VVLQLSAIEGLSSRDISEALRAERPPGVFVLIHFTRRAL
jgi:hypothetical protein